MLAEINKDGFLILCPENETEAYALKHFLAQSDWRDKIVSAFE